MIKISHAVALAALLSAGITILPGFMPQVEAGVPVAMAKADRLDMGPIGTACSEKAWPNFEASCMRNAGSKTVVSQARIVGAITR